MGATPVQVGQMIGEESAFDTVHAQLKAIGFGGRCNGVGAGLLLAFVVLGDGGDKLAGAVGKALKLI
jgi:hypothetical protein